MKNHILVIAAVKEELLHLSRAIRKGTTTGSGEKTGLSGVIGHRAVTLIASGPGCVNTVRALTAHIEKSRPAMVIQTGCAGGFRKSGITMGDLAVATEEIDIHTGIEPAENQDVFPLSPLPFPLLSVNGEERTNRFPLNRHLADTFIKNAQGSEQLKDAGLFKGPFITGSTITATDRRAEELFKAYRPVMESMEGAAAAHTAMHYDLPFLEIRAMSNFTGKRDRASWNLDLAFDRCSRAVVEFIKSSPMDLPEGFTQ